MTHSVPPALAASPLIAAAAAPGHAEVPDRLRSVKRHVPRPVKRAARAGLRRYGVGTAHRRDLPDFLVIGVKRGGTTSLWNWLTRHPHVAPMYPSAQQIKSPHFFDIHYARGLDWYRSHFPTRASVERTAARTGVRPLTGEASPYYVFHPLAAERVQAALPEVKLLLVLRNPVDRAYSNYWERRGSHAEDLPTFEQAIDAEAGRLAGEAARVVAEPGYYSPHHDHHSYLARGRYAEHLAPWLRRFDREQLLILPFERLTRDSVGTYREAQEFLGLPVVAPPELEHHNKLPAPPMAAATRARLVDYYRPWNARLRRMLKRDLDWDR